MKKIKRILSILLVCTMILSLAACQKKEKNPLEGNKPSKEQEAASQAAFEELKNYVYKESELKGIELGENSWINSTSFNDGKVYQLVLNSQYDENKESYTDKYSLYTTDIAANSITSIELEPLFTYTPSEVNPNFNDDCDYSGAYLDFIKILDGKIVGVANYYYSWEGKNEDYSDYLNYAVAALVSWDMSGMVTRLSDFFLVSDGQDNYSWINNLYISDGKYYITVEGNEKKTYVLEENGQFAESDPVFVGELADRYFAREVFTEDGKALLSWYNDDWTKMTVGLYDLKTKKMIKQAEVSETIQRTMNEIYPGLNTDIIFAGNDGIYSYNIGDAESKKLCDLLASDISASYLSSLVQIDEKRFFVQYYDQSDYSQVSAVLTKVNPEDVPVKKIITMGGFYPDSNIQNQIVKFNKSSDEYRITYKNFNNEVSYTDYDEFLKKVNTELMSGKMPDMLMISGDNLPYMTYAAKGLFADVGAMIAADPELSKQEFAKNVFDAYKYKDKLYFVISGFSVQSYVGMKDIVGEPKDFTIDKLKALMNQYPDSQVMEYMTRDYFVNVALQYCGNTFIDTDTNKCDFNSSTFKSILEIAKTFPKEYDYSIYEDDFNGDYTSQFLNGKILLRNAYMSGFDMSYEINCLYQKKGSYVGFPTANGGSSVLAANNMVAISSKTAYPEACFSFAKFLLSEEYQEKNGWNFPTLLSVMDKRMEEAQKGYTYIDEAGNEVQQPMYVWINGENVEYFPLSKAQCEEIKNFVLSIDKISFYNDDVMKIVSEEVESYFENKKSVDEVASLINNRVQLYYNENS